MSRSALDPGANTRQAEGFEGDAAAAQIRALLKRLQPEPAVEPVKTDDEEEPWR